MTPLDLLMMGMPVYDDYEIYPVSAMPFMLKLQSLVIKEWRRRFGQQAVLNLFWT